MAALLSVGVATWLHGLHAVGLIGATWAGGAAHVVRDGLLNFPLAVAAVAAGDWSAERWDKGGSSTRGLLAEAALTTLVFTLLLVLAARPHQLVDRALDGAAHAHAHHGYVRAADAGRAPGVAGALQQGLCDALLGAAVSLPLMFLGLTLRPGKGQDRPAALVVAATVALPVLTVVVVGFGLASPVGLHKERHQLGAHAPLVTSVTAGTAVEATDLRVTVRSAKWVRQPRGAEPDRAAPTATDLDRIYLEVEIENLMPSTREVGRGEFLMRARDGTTWAPLADDFPPVPLGPGETFTTWLVFELPPETAHLDLVVSAGADRPHIPIEDDWLGGIFGALCRALSKSWKG
jgi:hypothetical protein